MKIETLWHVTVLSNFVLGYDKYSRRYSKEAITMPLPSLPIRESTSLFVKEHECRPSQTSQ